MNDDIINIATCENIPTLASEIEHESVSYASGRDMKAKDGMDIMYTALNKAIFVDWSYSIVVNDLPAIFKFPTSVAKYGTRSYVKKEITEFLTETEYGENFSNVYNLTEKHIEAISATAAGVAGGIVKSCVSAVNTVAVAKMAYAVKIYGAAPVEGAVDATAFLAKAYAPMWEGYIDLAAAGVKNGFPVVMDSIINAYIAESFISVRGIAAEVINNVGYELCNIDTGCSSALGQFIATTYLEAIDPFLKGSDMGVSEAIFSASQGAIAIEVGYTPNEHYFSDVAKCIEHSSGPNSCVYNRTSQVIIDTSVYMDKLSGNYAANVIKCAYADNKMECVYDAATNAAELIAVNLEGAVSEVLDFHAYDFVA